MSIYLLMLVMSILIVIPLQGYKFGLELISWKDLLALLKGTYKDGSVTGINKDVPIFAINRSKMEYLEKHNIRGRKETKIADVSENT